MMHLFPFLFHVAHPLLRSFSRIFVILGVQDETIKSHLPPGSGWSVSRYDIYSGPAKYCGTTYTPLSHTVSDVL